MKNRMLVALWEEYKKSSEEYTAVLDTISQIEFERIVDGNSPRLESIKAITFHAVEAGYIYANYVNAIRSKEWYTYKGLMETPAQATSEIRRMLAFTEELFSAILDKRDEEIEQWKFETKWGVTYDFEQLMEHAIVHILRHRRQISNFLND
jgi:uncharacterized damage-inducible protein DinB